MKAILSKILIFSMIVAGTWTMGLAKGEASDVVTWRVPCHWPSASASFKGSMQALADTVKERTDGKFILEPHAAGSIVPGPDVFNAVRRGMVPMGATSSAYDLSRIPILNVVAGLPLNFAEEWEAVYFHKWLGFEEMVQEIFLENYGLLFFSDKIFTTELSLKRPVRSMEDFQGLKLRSSGILQRYLTSIGASATMVPGGDIYTGLASGMLEGAHWGAVLGSSSMRFYEINKYHLRPPLNVAATDIWVINKAAFDKLSEEFQTVLVDTLEEHFWRRTNQYQYQEEAELVRIQAEEGVTLLTMPDEEFSKMQAAAIKIWDEVAKMSPENEKSVEMLKEFNRNMGRLE